MVYIKPERNYEGVQFGELRKRIEEPYTDLHDELCEAYYDHKPFREYGVLNKELYDELHGLIFQLLAVKFHEENLKQPAEKRHSEDEYRYARDAKGNVLFDHLQIAKDQIEDKKKRGIVLKI
jgi:hypothetical protein